MPVGACKTPGDECSAAARQRGNKTTSRAVRLLLQLCSGLRVVCVHRVNTPVRSRRMWDKLLRALSAGSMSACVYACTIVCCTGQRAVAVEHDLDREAYDKRACTTSTPSFSRTLQYPSQEGENPRRIVYPRLVMYIFAVLRTPYLAVGKCGYFYFHHCCVPVMPNAYVYGDVPTWRDHATTRTGQSIREADKEERTADAANRRQRRPARKQEAGANLSRLL